MKKKRQHPTERPKREPVRDKAVKGSPRAAVRPALRERASPTEPNRDNLIFGVLPVLEALRSDPGRIDKIIFADTAKEHRLSEISQLSRQLGVTVTRLDRDKFSRLAPPEANTQGVIAYAAPVAYAEADELLDSADDASLFLILDGIEDPRNLGAVIRSAECAGASGIFIPDRRAVGLTDAVAKSSAGAIEHIKIAKVANITKLIERLKRQNVWVIGTSGGVAMSYSSWDWNRPSAIVLGSEGSGLHRLVAENCDMLVNIPMYGKIDSLNVSVAAGVILFEARRQRNRED